MKYWSNLLFLAFHGDSYVIPIVTARKRSLGQGNMFTGVCLSTGGSTWPATPSPPGTRYTPLGADPPEQTAPASRHPLRVDTPPGADTALGADTPREQTPPLAAEHAGRYGQRAGGTPYRILLECKLVYL